MARFVQVTETAYYVEEGDPVWMVVITDPMRFVKVEARDEEDLAEFLATEPGDVLFVQTMVDFLTPDSIPITKPTSMMQEAKKIKKQVAEAYKKCPSCVEKIRSEAIVCQY